VTPFHASMPKAREGSRLARIEKRTKFLLNGATYEHADPQPEHTPGSVTRFEHRMEPKVIAQVPLAGGGTAEVHGYATFYSPEWVDVVWTDENYQHFDCWVPAGGITRPYGDEGHGRDVSF
jgi:hypothetical protein